jgi:RNA methyltransferase, TrmH family
LQTLTLGKHNTKLIELRKSIDRGLLTSDGLLPIEGPKLLEEALRSGIEVSEIFVRKDSVIPDLPPHAIIYELDPAVFKTIQSTETSQGIIALIRPRHFDLQQLIDEAKPLIVILSRLQDPGNVGTVLRVAESFYATGCIATIGTANIHNAKVVRATAGSLFRLPHVWNAPSDQVFQTMRGAGISVVGTSPSAIDDIDAWDWRRPTALVIGNEGSGLSEEELHMCDRVLKIPQNTAVQSLNSAIAAAIVLYEASKQRKAT